MTTQWRDPDPLTDESRRTDELERARIEAMERDVAEDPDMSGSVVEPAEPSTDPRVGGGIEHVADCTSQYFKGEHFDPDTLIDYATRLRNGAIFKRLGFLASQMLGDSHPLTTACRSRLSKGNAQLDPALKGRKLITHWRLFIPTDLQLGSSTQ